MLKLVSTALTIFLLVGIGVDRKRRERTPVNVEEYHAHVRDSAVLIPYRIGNWIGVDKEIRQDALRMVGANLSLSRVYKNLQTGRTATLLLVQSADARSLLGHYPPVCYPSQGWSKIGSSLRRIPTEMGAIFATEYSFAYETLEATAQLAVLHFSILPNGRTAPDMGPLETSARNNATKFFGGSSLQIIVDANIPEFERGQIYEELLRAVSSWIDATRIELKL